jgi:hypothetical protein
MLRCARLTMIVFAFLDICGLASHGQSTTVASQASTQLTSRDPAPRQIVRGRGFVNDPIKIVDILYDGKPVMGSRPFDAPDDWLSHVDVIVKNASSKPLVAGNFQLTFDGVGGERPLTHYIRFGAIPGHALQMPRRHTRSAHRRAIKRSHSSRRHSNIVTQRFLSSITRATFGCHIPFKCYGMHYRLWRLLV